MTKRKYSSRDDDKLEDIEIPLVKKFNKLSHDDADDGYETDATIIEEDYDPEYERKLYMANLQVPPKTPSPMKYGPEAATHLVDKNGDPLYLQSSSISSRIPYTTHHLRQQYPATNLSGHFKDLSEYTLGKPNNNVGGSLKKRKRSGRRTIKRKYKKRSATRKRKTFRRKRTTKRRGNTRGKMHRKTTR